MSLPLGHMAVGLTAFDVTSGRISVFRDWRLAVFAILLANLPDIDILFGLLLTGNGAFFHRGPTHSLLFAGAAGLAAANCWRLRLNIPKVTFARSFLLVSSHVVADLLFTSTPVSLLWPYELYVSSGFHDWHQVIHSFLANVLDDLDIIMACLAIVLCRRLVLAELITFLPGFAHNRRVNDRPAPDRNPKLQ
jgi:hypothetical protein